jgi:hypothetical protein
MHVAGIARHAIEHSTPETVRLTAGKTRLLLFRCKDLPRKSLQRKFTNETSKLRWLRTISPRRAGGAAILRRQTTCLGRLENNITGIAVC